MERTFDLTTSKYRKDMEVLNTIAEEKNNYDLALTTSVEYIEHIIDICRKNEYRGVYAEIMHYIYDRCDDIVRDMKFKVEL